MTKKGQKKRKKKKVGEKEKMTFPFSIQGARHLNERLSLLKTKMKEEESLSFEKQRLQRGMKRTLKFRKTATPEEVAYSKLGRELSQYDMITKERRNKLRNDMISLDQFRFLSMKYLAASLCLLDLYDIYDNDDELTPEMLQENNRNGFIYRILRQQASSPPSTIMIKEQLFKYCYLIKNNKETTPAFVVNEPEYAEEEIEDRDEEGEVSDEEGYRD
jgi:hypothetical protein